MCAIALLFRRSLLCGCGVERKIPRSRQSDDIIFSVFCSGFILELRYDNIMTGRGQGYYSRDWAGWTFWSILSQLGQIGQFEGF